MCKTKFIINRITRTVQMEFIIMKNLFKKAWRPALAIFIFIILWEIASRIFSIEAWLLPSPLVIINEAIEVFPTFIPHLLSTAKLSAIGYIIGVLVGLTLATALHLSRPIRETLYPFLIMSQNIPIIVLAPLFLIWFGFGSFPKLLIIALSSFFAIALSTLGGFQQTDRELLHYMKMMGASHKQTFVKLELPHALPAIFTGLKISATYSVMAGVVSEWLGAQEGIGVFMTLAASSYRTPRVFVAIVATVLLSLTFFGIILLLERLFIRWQREEN